VEGDGGQGRKGESAAVVYEEIGDTKSSFSYTQNVLYGLSTDIPSVPEAQTQNNNYELIETVIQEYESIDDAYKVHQCSAYGVVSAEGSCDLRESGDPDISSGPSPSHQEESNPALHDDADQYQVKNCPAYGVPNTLNDDNCSQVM
jgi:hypothetical protein